jgi:hypothetical protein
VGCGVWGKGGRVKSQFIASLCPVVIGQILL